ncbi:hypothetical protein ACTA71_005524 [Dictyostelium dimigraforme]
MKLKATGINYKDYLIYCGLVPAESINHNGDINNPEFQRSYQEAASMLCVYLTSLCSIFNVGSFSIKGNGSILIHSGTGDVGLSALNILKWKGHKSNVFVTVGSKEKEQYPLDTYGYFITGIYLSDKK